MDGNNNGFEQIGSQYDPQYGQNPYGYGMPSYSGYGMPQEPVFDERGTRKNFSRIGLSYFALWLISIVLGNVLALAAYLLLPTSVYENYLVTILIAIIPMYLIGAPVCMLMMQKVPAETPARTHWNAGQIIGGFIVAYALMRFGSIIGVYIGSMIEAVFPDAQATTSNVEELVMTGEMWVNVIAMVMIGPVVEELLFRKLLCDRLKPYGDAVTVVVTGLMFGIFHGNVTQGVYACLLGAFLAYVYLRTGNIFITIGYHVGVNFMGSVIPLLIMNASNVDGMDAVLASGDADMLAEFVAENLSSFILIGGYVLMIYGIMFCGAIIMLVTLVRGRVKLYKGRITIPSGRGFTTVILNVGMILFLLGGIFEILLSTFG